ncbi:MAG: hypothetical protein ACRD1T_11700, partial [Acidimicrobiia bacterium]
LREMLKKEGLELNRDYSIIQGGPTTQRLASLKGCNTSATMVLGGDLPRARELGFTEIARLHDYVPNLQFHSFIVDSRWAEANSQLTVRYLKAMSAYAQGRGRGSGNEAYGNPPEIHPPQRRRVSVAGNHQPRRLGESRRIPAADRPDGRETL